MVNGLEKYIEEATKTLGLDKIRFLNLVKEKLKTDEINFDGPAIGEVVIINEMLLTNSSLNFCLRSGFVYDKQSHLRSIAQIALSGHYPYKKTKEIKNYIKTYKKDQWKTESEFYGPRLLWQGRINRFLGDYLHIKNFKVRLPFIEDIFGNFLMKAFTFSIIFFDRKKYFKIHQTLKGYSHYNCKYGAEILFEDDRILYRKDSKISDTDEYFLSVYKLNKIATSFQLRNENVPQIQQDSADDLIGPITPRFWQEKRIKAGLTQAQVANKLGYYSSDTINDWEKGKSGPARADIPKILEIYKINVDSYIKAILEDQRQEMQKEFRKSGKQNN